MSDVRLTTVEFDPARPVALRSHGPGGLIEVWGPAEPVVIRPAVPAPKPQAIITNYE